ncbi:MAG: flagellar export protein FliJ [Desulfovibrio sp.]|nr:flagellar export protein FliJ [Desulfovibrio sp.]
MQKVLDYRGQLEEEAKVRLADAQRRHEEAQRRLQSLEAALYEARDKARDMILKDAAERWLHEGYVKGLSADVSAALLQARLAAGMVDEARKLLVERSVDKKMLDKLKTRKSRQHMHEELMKEQRANDEIATLRYKASAF